MQVVGPRVRMSICAVLDYNGVDDMYKGMIRLANSGQSKWAETHSEEAARRKEEARLAEAEANKPTMRMRFDGRMVPMESDAVTGLCK